MKSPVFGISYVPISENSSSLSYVNLGVAVFNNNSKSLFNVAIAVSYKTTEKGWNTTEEIIGFLDIHQNKQIEVTIGHPYLSFWEAEIAGRYAAGYVLNASDYKISAYGFAKP